MAVIDEQHRFGVHQRLTLTGKGKAVDVLVMTATPTPRTLMLTAHGDMDVSRLTERPPGRQPIETRTLSLDRLDEVVDGVARALARDAQVYRSEEHTSELQSLLRISYAVFCLKKKNDKVH